MIRRAFLSILGGAMVWPPNAHGQQVGGTKKIAVLMGSAPTELGKSYLATFVRRLAQLGWVQGRDAQIEVRWWENGPDEMRRVVGQLSALQPDVMMVFSNLALALVQSVADNIPVVFVGVISRGIPRAGSGALGRFTKRRQLTSGNAGICGTRAGRRVYSRQGGGADARAGRRTQAGRHAGG